MKRLSNSRLLPDIQAGIALVPLGIWRLVEHADLFIGTDPILAGLHSYIDTDDGRSYRLTPHVCYPSHLLHLPADRRNTTIVVPDKLTRNRWDVVHEFGHVLDERLRFEHQAVPISDYAKTNRYEAFAVAFEAWCSPYYPDWHRLYASDPMTVAIFDRLSSAE